MIEADARMQKLVKELQDEILRDTADLLRYLDTYRIESPIERLFAVALFMGADENDGILMRFGGQPREDPGGRMLHVVPQWNDLGWPADFWLGIFAGGLRHFAVVECDGHDFHALTPKQLHRDQHRSRIVEEHGGKMLRFTGTEINRAPLRLVREDVICGWAMPLWTGEVEP